MSKVIKGMAYALCVFIAVWFVASWVDVVANNDKPSPQHSEYNMFVLGTKQEQEDVEETGTCGSPLLTTTDIRFGSIYEVTDNSVIFETDEGQLYETFVGNPQDFHTDRYYCLFFEGEEIVKCWEEHW